MTDPAKIVGLRAMLDRDGFVHFKNGSTVKVDREGLVVRRAGTIVTRHGSLESAYRRAIAPLSKAGPVRNYPQPTPRDYGDCPF